MDELPTELKLTIVSHVANQPLLPKQHARILQIPRSVRNRTECNHGSLKSLSALNKQWRAVVKPHLFSRLVLYMGGGQYGNRSSSTRFRLALQAASESMKQLPELYGDCSDPTPCMIESMTVEIDPILVSNSPPLRNPTHHSIDIITMYNFWRWMFACVNPTRLAVLAPVGIHGWLVTANPEMEYVWAFMDMSTQMLELFQDPDRTVLRHAPSASAPDKTKRNAGWDTDYLFDALPWTGLCLTEGSMLTAYAMYEYFHLRPPSVIEGLLRLRGDTLQSFRLHCLFPSSSHVSRARIESLLSHFKALHFHFTPSPNMDILDDPAVVGKADMSDCWSEVEQIYDCFCTVMRSRPGLALREFTTGDYAVESVRRILELGFEGVEHQGWTSCGNGRWTREHANDTRGDSVVVL